MWSPLCPFWPVKNPSFGKKLPLQTTHHTFLESRHPEVIKNSYYVLSPMFCPSGKVQYLTLDLPKSFFLWIIRKTTTMNESLNIKLQANLGPNKKTLQLMTFLIHLSWLFIDFTNNRSIFWPKNYVDQKFHNFYRVCYIFWTIYGGFSFFVTTQGKQITSHWTFEKV